MIRGQVNAQREAAISLQVHGPGGRIISLNVTIDTGFSGFVTLPPTQITALQLAYDRTELYTLGDNQDVSFDLYRAIVAWDGRDRPVFVLSTEGGPLIGMAMLAGYTLFVDVIDGGEVRIEPRP